MLLLVLRAFGVENVGMNGGENSTIPLSLAVVVAAILEL